MKRIEIGAAVMLAGLLTFSASEAQTSAKANTRGRIFETNVTNNLNVASGEPEIAIDPRDPRNLAIIEFALGSAEVPAWSLNPLMDVRGEKQAAASMRYTGRVMLSRDGGNTWAPRPAPAYDPTRSPGGGDPMIAYGPDGSLYAADEPLPNPAQRAHMYEYRFVIAVSTDGGTTFSKPQQVPTPVDRPWLTVDQSTGIVYTASTGLLNPRTGAHNRQVKGAITDRWLTVWRPHLSAHSRPRRMGGPDFSAGMGNTMTAANGVIASTFVLGSLTFEGGPPSKGPTPIPDSLRPLVKDGVRSCSLTALCLFFQTSSDQGRTWTRHYVPVAGGFSGFFTYVSADPGFPGRYAVGVLNRDATGFRVLLTDDSGGTWSKPIAVPQVAPAAAPTAAAGAAGESPFDIMNRGTILKPWMAYGPSGVLGVMWKQRRDDLLGSAKLSGEPGRSVGPGFDVYAAISCDGGTTWLRPVKVNAEPSPAGPGSFDDLSYIALDTHYAHLVWGDRRDIAKVKNTATGIGGVQAYYGRVPFSLVSHGAQCGRR